MLPQALGNRACGGADAMRLGPKRVLQVLGAMNRGGVEAWLMHLLHLVDRRLLAIDFLVHSKEPADYDREIAACGSRAIPIGISWRSPAYGWATRSLLRQFGPYDAVHSHVHFFSGIVLAIARKLGIPVRIAHSHSDTSRQDGAASYFRRRYLAMARSRIEEHATHWLAASSAAGAALFGSRWGVDARSRVWHCGIDLQPFRRQSPREEMRARLGIRAGEFVVGHVGRFDVVKNHAFLVEAAAETVRRRPSLRLVLVGDGTLRTAVEQQVAAVGMTSRTLFLGSRPDVPDLLSAMDAFVFPSLWEGLPLAVVEAQAAGLPCLVSDAVTSEAVVAPDLVDRVSLASGPSGWSDRLAVLAGGTRISPQAALAVVEKTDFNIERSLETLYALYGI